MVVANVMGWASFNNTMISIQKTQPLRYGHRIMPGKMTLNSAVQKLLPKIFLGCDHELTSKQLKRCINELRYMVCFTLCTENRVKYKNRLTYEADAIPHNKSHTEKERRKI